jgi:Flp pilus assembly protein TadB
MTFAFFVSLLGFMIALRIFSHLRKSNLLSKDELTKIGTIYFIAVMSAISISSRLRILLWCAIFAPQALLIIMVKVRLHVRARQFRERFRETLTVVFLKMKAGRSFRQSLDEAIGESDSLMREKLAEIRSVVVFSQQSRGVSDPFVAEVIDEFSRVDRNPHAAIKRLSIFRSKLRIEDDFRHKSGQVLSQIRAQSFIMSGLYLAVAIFVINRFGWSANRVAIVASVCLFTTGLLVIWFGGRRLRWKV